MARAIDDVVSLLNRLIQTEYDAVEARRTAIALLRETHDRQKLGAILADHTGHVDTLAGVVRNLGGEPLSHGDLRRVLAKGSGKEKAPASRWASAPNALSTLEALRCYEESTRAIYEEATSQPGVPIDVLAVLGRMVADEDKHIAWIRIRLTVPASTPPLSQK